MNYLIILVSVIVGWSNSDMGVVQKDSITELCGEMNVNRTLEVVWCNSLTLDMDHVWNTTLPLVYQDQIIIIASLGDDLGKDQNILFFDRSSGDLIDSFAISASKRAVYNMYVVNDLLIVDYPSTGIECIDLKTHKAIWNYEPGVQESNREISIVGNNIYVPILHGQKPYVDSTSIMKFDIASGKSQVVTSVTQKDYNGGSPLINNLRVEPNKDGEDVIYFALDIIFPKKRGYFDLWAFNEDSKNYEWKLEKLDTVILQYHPVLIYENVLTVLGENIYTISKDSGEIIASNAINGNFRITAPLLVKDKIFAKSAQKQLYCIDALTGNITWENTNPGTISQNRLNHYNGVLYYSGFEHALYGIDMETGEQLLKEKTPFKTGFFSIGGQVIDEETNQIYICDGIRLMAISI